MCNIKTGADVKHHGDLQNLVTSTILRQVDAFSVEDIYNQVNEKLVGSKYCNAGLVRQLCADTIDTLYNICGLSVVDTNPNKTNRYRLTLSWPAINKR